MKSNSSAGGRSPLAGARGVLASFPFSWPAPQAAQEKYLSSYHEETEKIYVELLKNNTSVIGIV